QHTEGLGVGGGEDGGGPVVAREQALGQVPGHRADVGAVAHVARADGGGGGRHRLAVALLTGSAGGEAERVAGLVADEGDVLVPELDQVAGGEPAALDVVGDHGGHGGA